MSAPLQLRSDFSAADLHSLARTSEDSDQTRRLLALAIIYDGGTRVQAARFGGVGVQIVRDWVVRFNEFGPDGLINRLAPGKVPLLNTAQREALAAVIEKGPTPYLDGVVRWRLVDLSAWILENLSVVISVKTLSKVLRSMNYRKLSTRPKHFKQDANLMDSFKKTSQPVWRKSRSTLKSTAK